MSNFERHFLLATYSKNKSTHCFPCDAHQDHFFCVGLGCLIVIKALPMKPWQGVSKGFHGTVGELSLHQCTAPTQASTEQTKQGWK